MATSLIFSDTCSICTEKFKQPRLLPCFHTFCLECLQQFVSSSSKDGQFFCPLCRYQVTLPEEGVAGFQTNFYIECRAEKQVHRGGECCGVCEQSATHSCRECEILLCETCTKYHKTLPVSRSHLLINLGDSSTGNTFLFMQQFCDKHKDEKMRFYCLACNKVICRDCKLTDHEGHKTKDIADVVEEARTSLTKTKVELEKHKTKLEKSIDLINEESSEMSKHIKDVKGEIDKLADSLMDMINKGRHKEMDRVTDMEKTYVKKYTDEQYRLTQRKTFLQSQIDHTDAMLKEGLDCDMLKVDSEMKQRLTEIEKEQQLGSEFDYKSLKKPDVIPITPGVLDVVRSAVSNVMMHAFPVSDKNILSMGAFQHFHVGPVHSISLTKNDHVISVHGERSYLCLYKKSSRKPTWVIRVNLDDVIKAGVRGVIDKHNKENPDHQIPADYYTDLKKPFPYMDTNDNGDVCYVIKDHNWVGIRTASGDVRTLTFNPFAEPSHEFKPVDVCWSNNQEIYIVDSEAGMIIVYSLQQGYQNSVELTGLLECPTSVVMDKEGSVFVGDCAGCICMYKPSTDY